MTFSIVARSPNGAWHGVAAASAHICIGALVPAARGGAGLASQGFVNLSHRERLGEAAGDPAGVLAALTVGDELAARRQIGLVGAVGEGVAYTGPDAPGWAGHRVGDGFAVQGCDLAGAEVLEAVAEAWLAGTPEEAFAVRLLAALAAGDEAGGDRRDVRSAALVVAGEGLGYAGIGDVMVDLRVDDHDNPLPELRRVLGAYENAFGSPGPVEPRLLF